MLAAEKGRGGEVYFVTDGEAHDYRDFWTAILESQGVAAGDKSMPLWLARIIASVGELVWKTFGFKGVPPLPRSVLNIAGCPMVIRDAKARRELGYEGKMTFEQGLREMTDLPG